MSTAIRSTLGRDQSDHDIAGRFDHDTGDAFVQRHFPNVELRLWPGEMVIANPRDVDALWQKWEPALIAKNDQQAVRVEFLRLARERLARDGHLRVRRRNGSFACDLP